MSNIDRFRFLWEQSSRFVLGLAPAKVDRLIYFGNSKYAPYRKDPLGYTCFLIPSDIAVAVIDKMFAGGTEVLEYVPMETPEESVKHLWTDKVAEFILIPNPHLQPPYMIFHKEYQEYVAFYQASSDFYEEIIAKMIEAGVEIAENENPSIDSKGNL